MEEHVDIDALLEIAASACVPPAPDSVAAAAVPRSVPDATPRVRIGVARDAAFGLCYSECADPALLLPLLALILQQQLPVPGLPCLPLL